MPKRNPKGKVSGVQFDILLRFLERNPCLCEPRVANTPKRSRKRMTQLWEELADALNAEETGPLKTAKEWTIYIYNYKYRLKRLLADLHSKGKKTKRGISLKDLLSEKDQKFAAILGPGFWQSVSKDSADLDDSAEELEEKPSVSPASRTLYYEEDGMIETNAENTSEDWSMDSTASQSNPITTTTPTTLNVAKPNGTCQKSIPKTTTASHVPPPAIAQSDVPTLSRKISGFGCRQLSTLEEARRALNEVEMQVEANDVLIEHITLIENHLGRLANVAEKALQYFVENGKK